MAKAAAKSSTSKRQSPSPRTSRAGAPGNHSIEKASEVALQKLQELGLDGQLQRDIEWCLGSYRADQNPVGLYEKATQALEVLRNEKEKKTRGVTAKLISDLEKALKSQG